MEIVIGLVLLIVATLVLGPIAFLLLNLVFQPFNYLQWALERPWRWLARRRTSVNYAVFSLMLPIRILMFFGIWFVLLPLRVLNAVYFNLFIHNLWTLRDQFMELIHPQRAGYRQLSGVRYGGRWIGAFPGRLARFTLRMFLSFAESVALCVVDTVFPTLTMYHGTSFEAAANIVQDGWRVGSGNFAGTGLYFAMSRAAAQHYSHDQPVVVCVRVTLGRNLPLACAPKSVRDAFARDGDAITNWGRSRRVTSIEHWREDGAWWEYCILESRKRSVIRTWRIRPLYVLSNGRLLPERIWGGTYSWLAQPSSWPVFVVACLVVWFLLRMTNST